MSTPNLQRDTPTPISYYLLLCLFLVWTAVGSFPLYCSFEGDALRIIAGSSVMYNQGWCVPPLVSYQYGMQPLIIYMIVAVKHLLPFLSCNAIYSLLSAAAALTAIPVAVSLVHHLTGLGKTLVLCAFILLPETYAIATYPNSSVFPYLLTLWALLLIVKEARLWKPLTLMCIAPLFRIDIVIVYPVIFLIFLYQGKSFKQSLAYSFIAAIAVVAVAVAVYAPLKANPFNTLDVANKMNEAKTLLTKVYIAIYSFYTIINLVLLPIGIICLCKGGKWRLLAVALLPIILIHYFYRYNGGACKHYLYLLPFVAILTSNALHWLKAFSQRHKLVGYALYTALALFYIVSLRFDFPDKPWRNSEDSVSKKGPHLALFEAKNSPYHWQIGLGTSLGYFTEDELMLFSGHLLYPFYIHKVKSEQQQHIYQIKDYLDKNAPKKYVVLALTWDDLSHYPSTLLEDGYQYKLLAKRSFSMSNDKHEVNLMVHEMENDVNEVIKVSDHLKQMPSVKGAPIYFITQYESFHYPFDKMCGMGKCKKLMKGIYLLSSEP